MPDHERPLSQRGRESTQVLAAHLLKHRISPDLILCSTATRTRETLEGVLPGRDATIEPALFTAGSGQLLARLNEVDPDVTSVLVIGHNPAMQTLTLKLAASEAPDRPPGSEGLEQIRRKLPTGALVTLTFDTPWSELAAGAAQLVDYVRPKALLQRR